MSEICILFIHLCDSTLNFFYHEVYCVLNTYIKTIWMNDKTAYRL